MTPDSSFTPQEFFSPIALGELLIALNSLSLPSAVQQCPGLAAGEKFWLCSSGVSIFVPPLREETLLLFPFSHMPQEGELVQLLRWLQSMGARSTYPRYIGYSKGFLSFAPKVKFMQPGRPSSQARMVQALEGAVRKQMQSLPVNPSTREDFRMLTEYFLNEEIPKEVRVLHFRKLSPQKVKEYWEYRQSSRSEHSKPLPPTDGVAKRDAMQSNEDAQSVQDFSSAKEEEEGEGGIPGLSPPPQ